MIHNILQNLKEAVKKPTLFSMIALGFLFCTIGFLDKPLAVGLLLLLFLTISTFFIMQKANLTDKKVVTIFWVALLVHLGVALFIYYFNFNPFGGGADFTSYHGTAVEIAHRFGQWNLSLAGLPYTEQFFPVLIGILYMFTMPNMIVGQLFVVWLAAISVVLVYVMVLQIGGTKKAAFLAGLLSVFYPSYLFFGSVLLKDTLVIPFVLLGILLILKMVKRFSWLTFLVFFGLLTALIDLRFYVGYALMFSLIISWPILSSFKIKKRMAYWLVMIFLLGFSSQLAGNGYYAIDSFKNFLNPKSITYYREVVYANSPVPPPPSPATLTKPKPITTTNPVVNPPPKNTSSNNNPPKGAVNPIQTPGANPPAISSSVTTSQTPESVTEPNDGNGSTFALETGFHGGIFSFLKNSSQSFIYSLFGPFPWQLRYRRQFMGLLETIPWYILILLFLQSSFAFIKKNGLKKFLKSYRFTLPLLFFSVLTIGALSLFINNYGIIARIRIPAFICLASVMCVSFNNDDYEKISHYWRRGLHWLSLVAKTVIFGQ